MSSNRDTRTTADIYAEAVDTNNEVTSGLKNALRIVDDTREVQASTLEELQSQGEQLRGVQSSLNDVEDETVYARSVLDQVSCLCWCFGTGKPTRVPKQKKGTYKVEKKPTAAPKKDEKVEIIRPPPRATQASTEKNSATGDQDPAIAEIERGRQEQDNLIDQISAGLDVLKQGAAAMGTELDGQDETIEATQRQAEDAVQGTKETVNHAAFRRHLPRRY